MANITPAFKLDLDNLSINIAKSSNIKITNLTLTTMSVEQSHPLQNNLKQLIIRPRGAHNLQIAFIATESSTNFVSIYAGSNLKIDELDFNGKTIYLQSNKNSSTVEIIELY
jgi:hypothetical protein